MGRKETFNFFPAVESLPDFVGSFFDGGSDFYPKQSFPGAFFLEDQMGDGWLYWLLISIFSLTNRLLLKLHPELFLCQMRGLLIGGAVVAISIFPQVVNWQIDYTATSGQSIANDVLASTIFRGQQPLALPSKRIALFSHRGHAAIVLTLTAVICAVAWKRKLISDRTSTLILFIILPALLFTNTRTAILSLIIAIFYLLGRQYYKQLIPAIAIGLVAISAMTFTLTSGLESGICCTSNVQPIALVGTCCARDSKTTSLWLGF